MKRRRLKQVSKTRKKKERRFIALESRMRRLLYGSNSKNYEKTLLNLNRETNKALRDWKKLNDAEQKELRGGVPPKSIG